MTSATDRYYRSSGSVPFSGVFSALGPTVVVAAILGLVYAAIDWFNPFIYFTFIATAGFGLGVGYTLQSFLRMGKVRNRTAGIVLSLVAGVFALYASWVSFIWVLFYSSEGIHVLAYQPDLLMGAIQFFGENGIWEMNGSTPTGWGLYIVWILEALIIVGLTVSTALAKVTPFCEACHEWSRPALCPAYFALPESPDELVRDLEGENYEPLHRLTQLPYDLDDRLHVTVHECPHCDATWMSVDRVIITTDKDGKENTQDIPIVANLVIPSAEGDVLKGLTNFTAEAASSDQTQEPESEPETADEA